MSSVKRKKPDPIYSFFPIYSPFKVDDNAGFDLGEDNRIRTIFIKDGALRFEFSAVLRPGRFLGNYYLSFTVPIRTFIMSVERVKEMMANAREVRKQLELQQQNEEESKDSPVVDRLVKKIQLMKEGKSTPQPKGFFSRFYDGYKQIKKGEEEENKRMTLVISDWFGRQARRNQKP